MGHKSQKDRPAGDRLAAEAAPRVENRYAAAVVCGFLLLAVALAFGRTVGYGFVNYDDDIYVIENPHLTHGLAADEIAWAFTATRCNNWHPVTWLSYLVDSQLYGLAPWGYHLTNVLLHAASTILLFLVLRRMTGDLWPSALVAAVFAIHPLRVESVAWVAERKDVLSGLFFMLTLAAYVGYVRRPFSLVRYGLVVLLFALGLMAKPMLVTLPLVLLLLDYWPLDRLRLEWRLVVEKLPLLVLSAASCVATSVAQGRAIARIESLPLGSRAANSLVSSVAYIGQLFYPVGLAVFYPHPGDGLPIGQIVGAVILLAAVTAVAAVCWRRWAWLPVGWLWYLGMLVPVIGLVQVGAQSMANRYTYLPQIGLVMALAWSVKHLVRTWPERGWVCGVGAAAVLIGLMGCTWRQTTYWSSSEALWRHTLSCTSPSAKGHYNFGVALVEAGKTDEAIAEYREALDIKPDMAEAHNGLGIVLAKKKDYAEAIAHYRKAIELKPDLADIYGNFGLALFQQERWAEAIEEYEKAIEFKPDDVKARCNLATALARQGRTEEAIEQFQEVLKRQPKHAEAHSNLGLALAGAGRGEEAIAQFQQALESKPDFAEAHNNLGLALANAGRIDDAITHFQKALELSPSLAIAHENLAKAFSRQGKMPEAIAQWREVIRLQPKNQFARDQLARALAAKPEPTPSRSNHP